MNRKIVKKVRRIYIFFAILLGITSPLIYLFFYPQFDPRKQPISYFGTQENTHLFFTISLIIFSIALFWNGLKIIRNFIKIKKYKPFLTITLITSSISLVLTGLIPMNYETLHEIPALCFFLTYNFFVFFFGLIRSLSYVRRGIFSVITGSLMLLTALLLIPFPSYGVSEIVYLALLTFWNIIMWRRKKSIRR
tara:strand:- start:287 stop:865 length:579 start_codon:yes stop_codon:yes gene_type:complete